MNDAHPVGDSALLDVHIRQKAYRAASGARLDAVRDLRVSLRAGDVGALVGPSGCGKSTTLRIIAGLDHDYEGALRRPPRGRLGMVFQEPRLLPRRTVEEIIARAPVRAHAEPGGRVRLRVEVDDEGPLARLGEARSEVDRRRRLADAALLIG